MNGAKGSLRRVLLAAGTETYKHGDTFPGGLENLAAVPGELQAVVDSLSRLGYEPEQGPGGPFLLDPDVEVLSTAISRVAQEAQIAVVYYTGHGMKPDRHPYYVLTADSTSNNLRRTALEPRDLLIQLLRSEPDVPDAGQPQVLVILDCCYSGAGGTEMLKDSLQNVGNPNVWVIASASSIEEAGQGLFARAFAAALRSPKIGHSTDFVPLDLFLGEVNSALALHRPAQRARLIRGEITGTPEFFPNRGHVPAVAGLTVEEQVWVARLRGAPEESTATGIYVTGTTGRVRAVEDIAAWLRGPEDHGLAVITGSPGSGKSTLLALPVLLADREKAAPLLTGSAPDSLPARAAGLFAGLPVLGIYARGMDPYQATKTIAGHLSYQAKSPADLIYVIGKSREATPRIVVVDAVDESIDPKPLMDTLLLPLSRCPGMKVLVGARRHLIPPSGNSNGVTSSGDSNDAALLVDLDADDYRDPQALTEYARQLLLAVHESDVPTPYRDATDEITAAVAEAIAARATAAPSSKGQAESFLLARLLARAVRGRERVPDIVTPGWADRLPADVGAAFDEDLARLEQRESTIRALLLALALAQGPGLPWENIWVPVAQALATDADSQTPTLEDSDVRWLLDNAGGYVVEDLGPGQRSAFRPFHDMLAAHLRGEPGRETLLTDPSTAQAWQARSQQAETAITQALLDTVPAGSGGHLDWELAHPYLRTYLARHAHAAGPEHFARLVADPDYLAVADPVTLTPLLTPTDPALRVTARTYRRARPLLGTSPGDNAAYIQEAFLAETGRPPENQDIRPTYRTLIARPRRDDSLLTLTGLSGWAASVAFGSGAQGQLLLASGGHEGTVLLWDPYTGTQVREPLRHGTGLGSVAFGTRADGRPLLATAGTDGTVRLWDPDTGTEAHGPLDHGAPVTSVAFGARTDGHQLLASAGTDGTVRLWNPDTGTQVREPLRHSAGLGSVAFGTRADGRPLLATACTDGMVRLWDPDTGTGAHGPLDHGAPVTSVAFGARTDGHQLLASAGIDGTVRLWDPETGTEASGPLNHGRSVESVAFGTRADGRNILATGGDGGSIRLWDPDTGTETGEPLTGHGGGTASVSFGVGADKRLLLASAGWDGTVRLWAPDTGAKGSGRIAGHSGRVASVAFDVRADGRTLLASGGWDGMVRLWDPDTGSETGAPLHHDGGLVASVAFGVCADGRPVLASGGGDGRVRLWDPDTGAEIGATVSSGGGPASVDAGIWNPPGLAPWHPDPAQGGGVKLVVFGTAADGRPLLAIGEEDKVRLWDPDTGTEAREPLTGHGGRVTSVVFGTRADGRPLLVSACTDGTVRLWDPDTGTQARDPLRHSDWVRSVAFGTRADGRPLLATVGTDGTVRLWDPDAGTQIYRSLDHGAPVSSLAFGTRADGRPLLASAGTDGTVRLWEPDTGVMLTTLRRRTTVNMVALHGTVLAVADDEGLAVVEIPYAT